MPPVVVGLRNPGPGYSGTRHNVGDEILAIYALRNGLKFRKARLGIRAEVSEVKVEGGRHVFAVPRTFMNESGQVVAPLLRYYRSAAEELLVLHDDIDLPFGRIRFQFGRGAGGHNGVSLCHTIVEDQRLLAVEIRGRPATGPGGSCGFRPEAIHRNGATGGRPPHSDRGG